MNKPFSNEVFASLKPLTLSKTKVMNDRPNDLVRIRPQIKKTQQFSTTSTEERFQNRPYGPF